MLKLLNYDDVKKGNVTKLQIVIYSLVLSVIVYAGKQIPKHFAFSLTDSVGHKLFYFKKGVPESVSNGDFVIFNIKTDKKLIPQCSPTCRVIKKVGCTEGQNLTVTHDGKYYCDARFLGVSKTESKTGVSVQPFKYNGIVPKDSIFSIGTSGDSYDSKYYGFVKKEIIKGVGIPVF